MALNIPLPGHPEKVLRYVNRAISCYQPGTTTLQGLAIVRFEKYLYILGDLIKIPNMPYNNDEKRYIIRAAIEKFASYRRRSLYLLRKAIQSVRERRNKIPKNSYYVIFPTNLPIKAFSRRKFLKIGNIRLHINSLSVLKNFTFPSHVIQTTVADLKKVYGSQDICLEIILRARDSNEAFSRAYWWFEVYRALINFSLSYGKITYHFGRPKPLSTFLPPKHMLVFDHGKRFSADWHSYPTYDRYHTISLRQNQIAAIDKVIKRFNRLKRNHLKNRLTEVLRLYNFALDEVEKGYSFLNFWQILELVTLKDPHEVSTERMKKRIKSIFLRDPVVPDLVDALFEKRNQLVHEGALSQFSQDDVNQIKIIAEGCIELFLLTSLPNVLQTKANLHDFYDSLALEKPRIREKRRILGYVLRI